MRRSSTTPRTITSSTSRRIRGVIAASAAPASAAPPDSRPRRGNGSMRARIVLALSMASLLIAPCAVSAGGPLHPEHGGEFRVRPDRVRTTPPFSAPRHLGRHVLRIVPVYVPDDVAYAPSDGRVIVPRAPLPPPPPPA